LAGRSRENTPLLVSMALDDVLSNLEAESYSFRAFIIPACAVEARHRRDRVWILAYTDTSSGSPEHKQQHSERANKSLAGREDVANASGSGREEQHAPRESDSQGLYTGSNAEGWREWPVESGFCRVAHGIPNRTHRLKGLGNAIVPQIAYQIIKEIRKLI
jgi:DNA (cytosine-5)-methyltransferase 1